MSRELTREKRAAIRALVVKCAPIVTGSMAVLPLDPRLEAIRERMAEAAIRNMSACI